MHEFEIKDQEVKMCGAWHHEGGLEMWYALSVVAVELIVR